MQQLQETPGKIKLFLDFKQSPILPIASIEEKFSSFFQKLESFQIKEAFFLYNTSNPSIFLETLDFLFSLNQSKYSKPR